jgi:hypothetical protein
MSGPDLPVLDDDDYESVRLTIDHFLIPGRPHGKTDSVEWHCNTCRTGGDGPEIHEAVTGLTAHMYRHHHGGPGALS